MGRVYIKTMKMMTEHYFGQEGRNKRKDYINKNNKKVENSGNKPHGNLLFGKEKRVNCRKQYMFTN